MKSLQLIRLIQGWNRRPHVKTEKTVLDTIKEWITGISCETADELEFTVLDTFIGLWENNDQFLKRKGVPFPTLVHITPKEIEVYWNSKYYTPVFGSSDLTLTLSISGVKAHTRDISKSFASIADIDYQCSPFDLVDFKNLSDWLAFHIVGK